MNFVCSPFEDLDVKLFLQGRNIDIFYSEPILNVTKLKYLAASRRRQGFEGNAATHEKIIKALFNVIKTMKGFVFLIVEEEFEDEITFLMWRHATSVKREKICFSGEKNGVLIYGNTKGYITPDVKEAKNQRRQIVASLCIGRIGRPGDVVFDPFCGNGFAGIASKLCGMDFYGSDASPKAIEKAKEVISGFRRYGT